MGIKKRVLDYFSKGEIILWICSVCVITVSFCIFDRSNFLTLLASLLGVTALIFIAKGNPVGQVMMIGFSIVYGIISFSYSYYGEVITYLGMSMPMAFISLISWLKNPYKGKKSEVTVNRVRWKEYIFLAFLTLGVTVLFYFILKTFGTANILPSTVSVTTSFAAVYLTFRRSPYYALCYAANDVVLIVLWIMAAMEDISYLSVIVCFATFLVNDTYGFISWRRMQKRQKSGE